jgi:hypothetical protein
MLEDGPLIFGVVLSHMLSVVKHDIEGMSYEESGWCINLCLLHLQGPTTLPPRLLHLRAIQLAVGLARNLHHLT